MRFGCQSDRPRLSFAAVVNLQFEVDSALLGIDELLGHVESRSISVGNGFVHSRQISKVLDASHEALVVDVPQDRVEIFDRIRQNVAKDVEIRLRRFGEGLHAVADQFRRKSDVEDAQRAIGHRQRTIPVWIAREARQRVAVVFVMRAVGEVGSDDREVGRVGPRGLQALRLVPGDGRGVAVLTLHAHHARVRLGLFLAKTRLPVVTSRRLDHRECGFGLLAGAALTVEGACVVEIGCSDYEAVEMPVDARLKTEFTVTEFAVVVHLYVVHVDDVVLFEPGDGVEQRAIDRDVFADDSRHVDESRRGGARRHIVTSGGGNRPQVGGESGGATRLDGRGGGGGG